MVYKRYIKRGGKVYGPYIYHSRKENGKVISEYLGKAETKKIKYKKRKGYRNENEDLKRLIRHIKRK